MCQSARQNIKVACFTITLQTCHDKMSGWDLGIPILCTIIPVSMQRHAHVQVIVLWITQVHMVKHSVGTLELIPVFVYSSCVQRQKNF